MLWSHCHTFSTYHYKTKNGSLDFFSTLESGWWDDTVWSTPQTCNSTGGFIRCKTVLAYIKLRRPISVLYKDVLNFIYRGMGSQWNIFTNRILIYDEQYSSTFMNVFLVTAWAIYSMNHFWHHRTLVMILHKEFNLVQVDLEYHSNESILSWFRPCQS